jgi:hypothetical protein
LAESIPSSSTNKGLLKVLLEVRMEEEDDAEDRPCNSEAEDEVDEDGKVDMGTALLMASWKSISMSRNPFSNEAMISSLERLLVSSPPFLQIYS